MSDSTIASADVIERTAAALRANDFEVVVAATADEAKVAVLAAIPEGATVNTAGSATLIQLGIVEEIEQSGRYDPIRPKVMQMDRLAQADEVRRLTAAPDVEVGSVNALTESGQMLIASGSGSQLGPYAGTAGKLVIVVGAQKIVPDFDAALRRVYDYLLPIESERMQALMGRDSAVRKLLVLNADFPGRTTVVILAEAAGV